MPPAARLGDPTSHLGTIIGPGASTVLIGGMPAAIVGDKHSCPLPLSAGGPHPIAPFVLGSRTVLIGGVGILRVGDAAALPCCATILKGEATVIIGG